MSKDLQTFAFQSHQLRIIPDENGIHWFLAKDICDILGYTNSAKSIADNCRETGVTVSYIPTLSNNYTLIDEGNLYRLIIKSNKPESAPFEAWVCDEVLPTIRKTGSYNTPYGLKSRISETLTLAEFVAYQEQLVNFTEQLHRCHIVLSAEECLKLDLNKTLAKIQHEEREKQELYKVTDTIIQMEFEGKPRHEIVKATGKSFNNVRQVIFNARRDGLLPVKGGVA